MRPPTTIEKLVSRSLQYAKLDSLFQNYPYSNLTNYSDRSPVNLSLVIGGKLQNFVLFLPIGSDDQRHIF